MAVTAQKISEWFKRPLTDGVPEQHAHGAEKIRVGLEAVAHTIRREVPEGAEQTRAVTKLRESLDSARRAMICDSNSTH